MDSNDDIWNRIFSRLSRLQWDGNHHDGFDGWVARVNSTGQFDWAMKFGVDVDVGWDVVADNYDNLYVTGYYQNLTEFNASQLVDYTNPVTPSFSLHITILQLKDGIGLRIRVVQGYLSHSS